MLCLAWITIKNRLPVPLPLERGMQVRRLFFIVAYERGEGTIEIHRREGEQSHQDFLMDQ